MVERVPAPAGVGWRRVGEALAVLVVVAVVGLFVAAAVPGVVGADESYVVLSDSMSPSINAGAVVFVSDVPAEQIGEGDVVTYQRGEAKPVTHRVVAVESVDNEHRFITQGDANEDPDRQPVTAEQLRGRVGFHVPLIGYVISFAGTDLGLLSLVVVPAALLLVLEVRDLWRATEEEPMDGEGEP